MVLLRVDEIELPNAGDHSGFAAGTVSGAVSVVDWKDVRVICHGAFKAKSSDSISYGGGVRLKVGGIPMPSVGSSSTGISGISSSLIYWTR